MRTGKILRCDDTETDERVDPESCRALGIRSMLASPIRSGEKSGRPARSVFRAAHAFGEDDSAVLQRFAETILAAVNGAAARHDTCSRRRLLQNLSSPRPAAFCSLSEPEPRRN